MRIARIVLFISAAVFAAIGAAFLAWPVAMAGQAGMELTRSAAINDVRAVYGGMNVGIACFLLFCGLGSTRLATGLIAQIAVMVGLVSGRFLSLWIDGNPGAFMLVAHAIEIAGALAGVYAFIALKQESRAAAAKPSPAAATE